MKRALAILLLCPALSWGAISRTFCWDAPASGDPPTSYVISCGYTSGNYNQTQTLGNVTCGSITLLQGHNYFCTVNASNASGAGPAASSCQATSFAACSGAEPTWHENPGAPGKPGRQ